MERRKRRPPTKREAPGRQDGGHEAVVHALGRAPFFGSIDQQGRQHILTRSRLVRLRAGGCLWHEGDPALNLGVVVSGRLKVCWRSGASETLLDVAVPGDALGEVAFALGASYQSDVSCLRAATVLLVPVEAARQVLRSDPALAQALAADLATQLIRLYRAAHDLGATTVEQRLARALLRLAERLGEPFPGGTYLPIRLRQRDLAAMAATTVESVSRRIGAWQRRGLLTPQPAGYLIKDLEALRDLGEPTA